MRSPCARWCAGARMRPDRLVVGGSVAPGRGAAAALNTGHRWLRDHPRTPRVMCPRASGASPAAGLGRGGTQPVPGRCQRSVTSAATWTDGGCCAVAVPRRRPDGLAEMHTAVAFQGGGRAVAAQVSRAGHPSGRVNPWTLCSPRDRGGSGDRPVAVADDGSSSVGVAATGSRATSGDGAGSGLVRGGHCRTAGSGWCSSSHRRLGGHLLWSVGIARLAEANAARMAEVCDPWRRSSAGRPQCRLARGGRHLATLGPTAGVSHLGGDVSGALRGLHRTQGEWTPGSWRRRDGLTTYRRRPKPLPGAWPGCSPRADHAPDGRGRAGVRPGHGAAHGRCRSSPADG